MEHKDTLVIINEQHRLLPDQERLLNTHLGLNQYEVLAVPAKGWTRTETDNIMSELRAKTIIFVSPIPYMIKSLAFDSALNLAGQRSNDPHLSGDNHYVLDVMVMANDQRKKQELPDGKIIFTIPKTGWYLT